MSSEDGWKKQRENLEESFFTRRNCELLAGLRAQAMVEDRKRQLADASGISDPAVLDQLLAAKISAETIAAVAVIPLLAVAWSDGALEPTERQAILAACEEEGITADTACFQLLNGWLEEHPEKNLLAAWREFIHAARQRLSPAALQMLRDDVIARATKIAKSSGGFLGFHKISVTEQAVLDELRSAFGAG